MTVGKHRYRFRQQPSTDGLCWVIGCNHKRVTEPFVLPEDITMPTGYCSHHEEVVRRDLARPTPRTAAQKLRSYIDLYDPKHLICVRHYGRPYYLHPNRKCFVNQALQRDPKFHCKPCLHAICLDDPKGIENFKYYFKNPDVYVIVPKGAHRAVSCVMQACCLAHHPHYASVTFMDDALQGLAVPYKQKMHRLSDGQVHDALEAAEDAMLDADLWGFTMLCSTRWQAYVGSLYGSPASKNWHRTKSDYLATTTSSCLLYGACFGLRIGASRKLDATMSSGNDDVERSVRHILHYGSVVKLSEVCAQKRMFAAGGQQSVYGSMAARKRALERERSKLLRKAMAVAKAKGCVKGFHRVLQWWKRSNYLKRILLRNRRYFPRKWRHWL